MKLIYIAGTSHSGSTLLDLMLNAHSDIISGGELAMLNRQLRPRKSKRRPYVPCSCGAPSLHDCTYWKSVDLHSRSISGKVLSELDLSDATAPGCELAATAVLLKAMAAAADKEILLDSSKLPGRLAYLLTFKEFDVHPIHLIREPKGQIHSVRRKHGGLIKHIARYEWVHEQIRRILKDVRHTVVHYEDLVRDPEHTLKACLEPVGLVFESQQLRWADAVKHQVAGNGMRFKSSDRLVLDESWKDGLSPMQQATIDIGTALSQSLLRKAPDMTWRR
jgi:hypothetical protein